jgi:hypothetical protein
VLDVVMLRIRAWEVVARYNDVLTDFAEGRGSNELTSGAEGLLNSLASLPSEEITEKIGSFMGVLQSVLSMSAQERSRQVFMKLLDEGAPLIQNKFIMLLRDDANEFYNVRLGLRDRDLGRQRDQLVNHAFDFYQLMREYKETPELNKVTAKAKVVYGKFVNPKNANKMKPNPDARKSVNDSVMKQLENHLANMEAKSRNMETIDAELLAYRDVLIKYEMLIDQIAKTIEKLVVTKKHTSAFDDNVNKLAWSTTQLLWSTRVYYDIRWK